MQLPQAESKRARHCDHGKVDRPQSVRRPARGDGGWRGDTQDSRLAPFQHSYDYLSCCLLTFHEQSWF